MRVLVVGGGGREHALCWRLARDGHSVHCAPGNAGIATDAEIHDVSVSDADGLTELAERLGVELVVVGPEGPLSQGLGDALRSQGISVFGPGRDGAMLESSKTFAKEFFQTNSIPTGDFDSCVSMKEVETSIRRLGGNVVVKFDGLAGGKGVVVCDGAEQAHDAARAMLEGAAPGDGDKRVVIEERLTGRELSVMAITDGVNYQLLATAEDHKAVGDGDRGPNTGGMGAVSPAPWVSDVLLDRMRTEVFDPTIRGLAAANIEFRGVLYAGVMVDATGAPKMLEYNVRFGDPETQAVLPRLRGDFGELLLRAAQGRLDDTRLEWEEQPTCAVILASRGYPGTADTGKVIHGLESVDCAVLHAATRWVDNQLVTSGGRVLAIVARGRDVDQARTRAYANVAKVRFDGSHHRTDIGARVQSGLETSDKD